MATFRVISIGTLARNPLGMRAAEHHGGSEG
jgi:hypothetical protein